MINESKEHERAKKYAEAVLATAAVAAATEIAKGRQRWFTAEQIFVVVMSNRVSTGPLFKDIANLVIALQRAVQSNLLKYVSGKFSLYR